MTPTATALPALAPQDALEDKLEQLLPRADEEPTALHRAMRHAVFPAGKRIRPRLLITVAQACAAGEGELELALHAGCAIEFIHSASLVHDDLPCFDDAETRRGRPTVHAHFGEALAVLAGDALLTRAFEVMAETPSRLSRRALRIVALLGQATGSRSGIIGGQSLEEGTGKRGARPDLRALVESFTPDLLDRYHAMKTAALFRLAAEAGATAAGAADTRAWGEVGHCLGLSYQLADDLADVLGDEATAGKPLRRDASLGRPNAVLMEGERSARLRLELLLQKSRELAQALAVDPTPLAQLMDELYSHFLRAST